MNQRHAHDYYPDYIWKNQEKYPLPGNQEGRQGEYVHDLFTREALDFVRRRKDGPFFLYLAYTIPHANNEKSPEGMQVPSDWPYTGESWPQQEKNFAAMVTRMDSDIGKIMTELEKLKIDDNTLVLFSSDNGPHREGGHEPTFFQSSGPLRGIKRDLYEGGIRVPTLARWPGKIKTGAVSNQVGAFWDFLPTAVEAAGASAPRGIDGMSVLPALLGKRQKNHEYLYWEFHERGFTQAVRMGDWKAVRKGKDGPVELYDLAQDLGETRDLAEKNPAVVRKIREILQAARTESAEFPIRQK